MGSFIINRTPITRGNKVNAKDTDRCNWSITGRMNGKGESERGLVEEVKLTFLIKFTSFHCMGERQFWFNTKVTFSRGSSACDQVGEIWIRRRLA